LARHHARARALRSDQEAHDRDAGPHTRRRHGWLRHVRHAEPHHARALRPAAVPAYGYNEGLAFGFRVDDIEAASAEIAAAGGELLGEITRTADIGYAYRHFKGPDGRVYGLNQQD
jgi:predicted enzyme related to lactoylglutathione lyase